MSGDLITIRSMTDDDRPFIDSSWASSYYSACRIKDLLSPEEFHRFHRPIRERFFDRAGTNVLVAMATDDPGHILGWIATEDQPNCIAIHYVYIKSAYRRDYHIAARLVQAAVPRETIIVTHMTPRAAEIIRAKGLDYRFVPHLL